MSININSPYQHNNNIISAKKLKEKSSSDNNYRAITAPKYLPKYSINQFITEKDKQDKEINLQLLKESNKKNHSFLKPILAIIALAVFFAIKEK